MLYNSAKTVMDKNKRGIIFKKLGSLLADFTGIIITLVAAAYAIAREHSIIFIIAAAIAFPLWFKIVKKHWLSEQPVAASIARLTILIVAFALLNYGMNTFTYNRCYDSIVADSMGQIFEKKKADNDIISDIKVIAKQEKGDYLKISGKISYKNAGKDMEKDMTLYFDRYDGHIYESFKDLKAYRKSYRQEYKSYNLKNRTYFDDEEVEARVKKFYIDISQNKYESFIKNIKENQKDVIDNTKWKLLQQEISKLGKFKEEESTYESKWNIAEDEEHSQTMDIKLNMNFELGMEKIEIILDDDLNITYIDF